jgi:hypothetical protein
MKSGVRVPHTMHSLFVSDAQLLQLRAGDLAFYKPLHDLQRQVGYHTMTLLLLRPFSACTRTENRLPGLLLGSQHLERCWLIVVSTLLRSVPQLQGQLQFTFCGHMSDGKYIFATVGDI